MQSCSVSMTPPLQLLARVEVWNQRSRPAASPADPCIPHPALAPAYSTSTNSQERQTGKLSKMSIEGLLALDRSPNSFVGQLREQNGSALVAFGTCWEIDNYGQEQASCWAGISSPCNMLHLAMPG